METTLSLINSLIYVLYGYFVGKYIFNKKLKTTFQVVLAFVLYFILFYFIIFMLQPAYSIFLGTIMLIPLIKFLFDYELLNIISLSLIAYIITASIELLLIVTSSRSIIDSICSFNNYNTSKLIINILSIVFSFILIFFLKNIIKRIVNYIYNSKYNVPILLSLFIFCLILSMIIRFSDLVFSFDMMFDCIIILLLVTSIIFSIDRNSKLVSLSNYYNEIYEYSKLYEELNYDYRMKLHENKNQLLLIRGMTRKNNKKLNIFLDRLLDLNDELIDNYYLSDLSFIPFPGMKNLINNKLMELNKKGASIEVFVSDDLNNYNFSFICNKDYHDLSILLGVILDNMIDEVNISNKKLISLNVYIEDNLLHMSFANSIDRNINIDKIYKKGYSSKGNNRGVGLTLVSDVIKNSEILDCKSNIVYDFFIQDIIIKLPKIIN